jgi:predicted RND superfamily exporter protein
VIQAISDFEAFAEKEDFIVTALSPDDVLRDMHAAFSGGQTSPTEPLPKTRTLIAQYFALLAPADRQDFVDDSYSHAQIMMLSRDKGSAVFARFRGPANERLKALFTPLGITATITGVAAPFFASMDNITWEMIVGFVIGFTIVVIGMMIVLRSVRAGLLSILPNLLPALACFAVLAILKVDLNVGTTLFMSVSLGALFNTTIHLASRILDRIKEGKIVDETTIMDEAVRKVIPPAAFTTIVLGANFLVFLWSSYFDLVVFGLMSSIAIVLGLMSDTLVTPVLYRTFLLRPALRRAKIVQTANQSAR